MADGCDDPTQIDQLLRLVERGVVVAAASRYMRGGQQIGGPLLKSTLSRLAGLTLYWLARVGTRDATNSFKAYATDFVRDVGIESDAGFEIGIELVAKAAPARGSPVAEIPTIWLERAQGSRTSRSCAGFRATCAGTSSPSARNSPVEQIQRARTPKTGSEDGRA